MHAPALPPLQRRSIGGLHIVTKDVWIPDELRQQITAFTPRSALGRIVKQCLKFLPAEQAAELLDRITSTLVIESSLDIATRSYDERSGLHLLRDYGEVSHKVITTAGVSFLVDAWQNSVELESMRYHGFGSNSAAEAIGNTALGAEFTTQLSVDNTRGTGTLTENAATIFETVGSVIVDTGVTCEEHGLFSQAATGGGTLWDRSLTGSVVLSALDSIQATYRMTASAGG